MRIAVFGANGATGRLLTGQALAAGHEVVAATRRPQNFPLTHDRLTVAAADVYDADAVKACLDGADCVLSTLGVPFTRDPIDVYSTGVGNILAAAGDHRLRRLVVVSSSAAEPHRHADGGFLLNRVIQPLVTATIGKSTYADMRRMESLVRASGLDWTIVRPSGLFDAPEVSPYDVHEDQAPGVFTSRADLAACLLDQAGDRAFVHKVLAVTTTHGAPTLFQMLRKEAFKKE